MATNKLKSKWFKVKRSPGFRLNLADILFVTGLCGISFYVYSLHPELSLYGLPLYLGASFFCFCNIFRIGNKLEPFWYVPFFIIAAYCLTDINTALFWKLVLYVLEPWKWILITYHITQCPYYGLGYLWVNNYKKTKVEEKNE
jgi:hypothetical protein